MSQTSSQFSVLWDGRTLRMSKVRRLAEKWPFSPPEPQELTQHLTAQGAGGIRRERLNPSISGNQFF